MLGTRKYQGMFTEIWEDPKATRVELHPPCFSFEMIMPDDTDTIWSQKICLFKLKNQNQKNPNNLPPPKHNESNFLFKYRKLSVSDIVNAILKKKSVSYLVTVLL